MLNRVCEANGLRSGLLISLCVAADVALIDDRVLPFCTALPLISP